MLTLLLCILAYWRKSEGSLSVTNIKTRKAEILYWLAILFSNTLGTALGDFLADDSGLGFAGGALLIGSLLSLIIGANFYSRLSKILLFWLAFILTRPFGATVGDFLTKTHENGGLNFGTIHASLVLSLILGFTIIFTSFKKESKK